MQKYATIPDQEKNEPILAIRGIDTAEIWPSDRLTDLTPSPSQLSLALLDLVFLEAVNETIVEAVRDESRPPQRLAGRRVAVEEEVPRKRVHRPLLIPCRYRFLQIFRRLVLGWIDSYDSNQILIFSGFSRSTKLSG